MRSWLKNWLKHPLFYLAGFVLLSLLGMMTERNYQGRGPGKFNIKAFQEVLTRKEAYIGEFMDKMADGLQGRSINSWIAEEEYVTRLEVESRRNGFALLVYRNDSLVYWSDENIPVDACWPSGVFDSSFVYLSNAWHVAEYKDLPPYKIVGLVLIKNNFPYENKFLHNSFQADFKTPSWVTIAHSLVKTKNNFPVYNQEHQFLFSLSVKFYSFLSKTRIHPPLLFYLLGLILGLMGVRGILRKIKSARLYYVSLLGCAIVLVILRILQIQFRIPNILYNHEIFSPAVFAWSRAFPSLGDLMLDALLLFFVVYNLYFSNFSIRWYIRGNKPLAYLVIFIGFFVFSFASLFIYEIIRNLIINSSISFEIQRLLEISVYTFFSLFAIALLLVSLILYLDFLVINMRRIMPWYTLATFAVAAMVIAFLVFRVFLALPNVPTMLLWLVLTGFLIWIHYAEHPQFRYSIFLAIALVVSIYSTYFIAVNSNEKEQNTRKVLAVNIAAEHDAVAELLLDEVKRGITGDRRLADKLDKFEFSEKEYNEIVQYLLTNYFSGFWEQYFLYVEICNRKSNLIVGTDSLVNCFSFFDQKLSETGERVTDSCFFYLNDNDGRITYLGDFYFPFHGFSNRLFLQLDSKLVYEQLGYPELLLDEEFAKSGLPDRYSYAKYNRGKLIAQTGVFPYSLDLSVYHPSMDEFSIFTSEKFDHLVYRPDQNNTILLSQVKMNFVDILVLFAYLFVFYFILMNLMLLVIDLPGSLEQWQLNFKNKIQLSMIGMLFLALILIGGGAIYYSFDQYQRKHFENIREKIQSVYLELDHSFTYVDDLKPDWHPDQYLSLDALLVNVSSVFYSDINLYDTTGTLIASSRPEIFDQGLVGRKMNHEAFRQLKINKKAEYIHRETIGRMKHLSAYVPYINAKRKTLAYINLPYFTKQDVLTQEISTLVVAIVNISFLLILLTISIAVLISNRITNPLRIIQRRFSGIKLGEAGEQIVYRGKDEIAALVREYNRMVDELENSMELLARSERESAWREMAKQIAHEINNPLTPMKLSIQQIKRSFNDKSASWEEQFRKFTNTMIEQIDHLSSIATAFSNFARMPKTQFEPLDIVSKINNSIALFRNTSNVDFKVDLGGIDSLLIYADKEQMIGVFTNLIKNAIQSIPDDRKGIIRIILGQWNGFARVTIADNGKGIPIEMGDKLFVPNFTTKSSGMGLGLAIVKNIVENTGGKVWFETRAGEGSTFFVDLPLYNPPESNDTKNTW